MLKLNLVFFNILNVIDCLTTIIAVTVLGGTELNPIMAGIISYSPTLFLLIKLSVGLLCSGSLYVKKKYTILIFINIMYSIVILNNLYSLISLVRSI